ncbi:metallophosphoesterase family protein [Deinococcus aquiradiocola]|uniref:metallophosphoesterase family protein n=1 Tax=Deinococcus aquiradiocola TaxID=393059 RepID=UPI001667D74B|nr:metallophosphoesterase family protein [Deinococcus aquiradiocola]
MSAVRLLLLSDIHANGVALQAVMKDAWTRKFDRVISLGDALGYGPRPREVLDTLRDLDATCILGNHEDLMLRLIHSSDARSDGIVTQALEWQRNLLSKRDVAELHQWVDGIDDPQVGARYRHGTPTSLDDYSDSVTAARDIFANWLGRLGFVGHTHIPGVYATLNAPVGEWIKYQAFQDGGSYMVPPSARVILNPGSVGQPRDGNPQASYAIFDTARNNFQVYRVSYDIAQTQAQILEAGLPEVLAARLSIGK